MKPAADWRLVLAVGVASGLAASPFWAPDGGWLRPAVALVLLIVLFVERGRLAGPRLVLIGLVAAVAGLLIGTGRLESIDGGALKAGSGEMSRHGFVLEAPSDSQGTARFAFQMKQGKVLVEAAAGKAAGLTPGTGLEVSGELAPAPDWMRSDLERKGMRMVLRAELLRRDGLRRGGLNGLMDRVRDRAFAALAVAVPGREAALARGFVLGDDSEVDERTVEDFRRSGLSHLMAASGQNIVLLALLATPLLALGGVGPRARLLAIAALIVIYVPLAGGGPSIQRAGVMGIAGLVAMAATRAPSRVYALTAAVAITLALNPRATGDIGWQLSFAAVVGIMLLARPLQMRIAPLIGDEGWRRSLVEGIAVTTAATLATLPLTIFHFEQLPVATMPANLAVMPAVAPAMWMGMISAAFGQIDPRLAVPFNLVGSVCLAWVSQVAEWWGRPGWAVAELKLGGPAELAGLTLLLGLGVWMILRFWTVGQAPSRRGRWLSVVALVLLAAVLITAGLNGDGRRHLESPPAGGARVEVLDVGQGDAILIRPAGLAPILIDGGPPGGDLIGALESAGVERLAAVMLTHPDLDHYGGLLGLFGRFPVQRFIFDRVPGELAALARESGAKLRRVSQGDLLREGQVSLEILWPPTDDQPAASGGEGPETNARSIVALLTWRNFHMMLTGDAEAESVPMDPGPIDVLKVSHHGSEDDGLPALLDRTAPVLAVIPVGADNTYGHPVPEVLEELADDGIRTLRTDRDGTVSIVLGDGAWRAEYGK